MKRNIITAIAAGALLLGMAATNASAWNNGGQWMGYGTVYNGTNSQQFQVETRDVRMQTAKDQAELNALMSSPNPNNQRVGELTDSIAANQLAIGQISQKYSYAMTGNNMMGPGMMNGGYYGCW